MTPEEQEAAAKAAAASTTTTDAPPAEKIYDIEKGWVDKPKDVAFTNQEFVPLKAPASTAPADAPPKTDPPKTDPPVDDKAKVDTLPPAPVFNKEKYSKYGMDKEDDVFSALDNLDAMVKENDELKKRPTTVQHKSPTHEKLFNYLEQYPESTWSEVLKTGGEILGMDPDVADGVKVLQEAFIISHPMVSRDDAKKLFAHQHTNKYNLKPKAEYEDPAQYDRDKDLKDIEMKIEVDKARTVVRETKAKLTVAPKPDAAIAAKKEAPAEQVQAYTRDIDNVLNGITKGSGAAYFEKDTIRVKSDEKGEPIINIQLPPDKLKELKETMLVHIKNPGLYDNSGKIPNFDPVKGTLQLAFALWPEWISQQMAKQVDTLANIKKVEQIASITPDKLETIQGKDIKTMSPDDQFRELARKEKEKREAQGQQPVR